MLQEKLSIQEVSRPVRPHSIEQVRGPGAPARFVLRTDRVTAGRAPSCDVTIASPMISRQHVVFTRSGPEYSCEDCDSSNGVFLNGIRIQSAVLRQGDRIQIGDIVWIYHDGE